MAHNTYALNQIASVRKDRYKPRAGEELACIELEHIEKRSGRILGSTMVNTNSCTKNKFFKGDILFGKLRPNLRKFAYPSFDGLCSSEIWVLKPNTDLVLGKFLFYLIQSQEFIQEACKTAGTKMPRADWLVLEGFKFKIPSKDRQEKCIYILQTWDAAIEKIEALIVAKEKQLRWLIVSLINKGGHKKISISRFAKEISSRNQDNSIHRVLSVTNHSGFVLPENQFKKRVASDDLSNYKVVKSGQYAYNPARINVGSIARLDDWDVGVLSPMYVVFELDEGKINSDYFLHWLSSNEARQYIIKSAQGSVRKTVNFRDLGFIPIPLPHLEAQNEISHTLNAARREITLLRRLVDNYRYQRRWLMQRLLTGRMKAEK